MGRRINCFLVHYINSKSAPLIRPAATFSPDLGGEGTCERFSLKASFLTAHSISLPELRFAWSGLHQCIPFVPIRDIRG